MLSYLRSEATIKIPGPFPSVRMYEHVNVRLIWLFASWAAIAPLTFGHFNFLSLPHFSLISLATRCQLCRWATRSCTRPGCPPTWAPPTPTSARPRQRALSVESVSSDQTQVSHWSIVSWNKDRFDRLKKKWQERMGKTLKGVRADVCYRDALSLKNMNLIP